MVCAVDCRREEEVPALGFMTPWWHHSPMHHPHSPHHFNQTSAENLESVPSTSFLRILSSQNVKKTLIVFSGKFNSFASSHLFGLPNKYSVSTFQSKRGESKNTLSCNYLLKTFKLFQSKRKNTSRCNSLLKTPSPAFQSALCWMLSCTCNKQSNPIYFHHLHCSFCFCNQLKFDI